MKVSKFGGTSLANASQIRKVLAIVQSDPERQYVVPSAPGKRNSKDQKITDLLYEWYRLQKLCLSTNEVRQIIKARYVEIVCDLGIEFNLETEFVEIEKNIIEGASSDYVVSRGEYLIGKIIANALGYSFIDPATCICLDKQGHCKSYEKLRSIIHRKKVVIPGFYGSLPDGSIKTFSRGGSDITGAIVASAIRASVYENWTDVSGLLMADPRIINQPKKIEVVTYRELRELSYMGANVFHEEAMFPVQEFGIPTNIRNVNDPSDLGTYIVVEAGSERKNENVITGVAGRRNFTVIRIEKKMMNQEIGFVLKILAVLEKNTISFEHMPGGIDNLSIVIDDRQLNGKLEKVLSGIKESCLPDTIEVHRDIAMIVIVGQAMVHTPGVAVKVFDAIAQKGISVRIINQGSSEISIIIGVKGDDYEDAVRAIYDAFVK